MACPEHERGLVRRGQWLGAARQGPEARVVVGVGLDLLRQDVEAIKLCRAPRRDRRGSLELVLHDAFSRPGRVVLRPCRHRQRSEELLALSDRLGMRDDLCQLVHHGSGESHQAVVHPHHRLAHEMKTVLEEQVVGLVDAARLAVVHRDQAQLDAAHLDRLEDLADRGQRTQLGAPEQRQRALFRIGPGLSLICNETLVHDGRPSHYRTSGARRAASILRQRSST